MYSSNRIYNQLKLIARIESHEQSNRPDFSEYHIKPHDSFYDFGINNRKQQYFKYQLHLNNKNKLKTLKKFAISHKIKKKYEKLRLKKATSHSNEASNFFDKFPNIVQNEIFTYLDHQSLVNFSYAYPKYTHYVFKPKYWSKIDCNLNELMFDSLKDLEVLCRYLNNYLTKISIDWFITCPDKFQQLSRIFSHLPNLTYLQSRGIFDEFLNDLIEMIQVKTRKLKHFNIETNDISDEHLVRLAKMEKLESVVLHSSDISDDSMVYFMSTLKKLVYVDIDFDTIERAETIQLLFKKHGRTLEALRIKNASFGSHSFKNLNDCVNLKELSLSGDKFGGDLLTHVSKATKLELLELRDCYKISNSAFKKLFSKNSQLKNLKRLHLVNLDIRDNAFIALPSYCPHLEDLYIEMLTSLTDSGLERGLKKMNELRSLVINSTAGNLSFNFFRKVPKKLLSEIEYIYIDISNNPQLHKQNFDHLTSNITLVLHEGDSKYEYGFGGCFDEETDDDDEFYYSDYNRYYDGFMNPYNNGSYDYDDLGYPYFDQDEAYAEYYNMIYE